MYREKILTAVNGSSLFSDRGDFSILAVSSLSVLIAAFGFWRVLWLWDLMDDAMMDKVLLIKYSQVTANLMWRDVSAWHRAPYSQVLPSPPFLPDEWFIFKKRMSTAKHRSAHAKAILGPEFYAQLANTNVLLVGAGGIGCELRKWPEVLENFLLMSLCWQWKQSLWRALEKSRSLIWTPLTCRTSIDSFYLKRRT